MICIAAMRVAAIDRREDEPVSAHPKAGCVAGAKATARA
jgi:hypothetical protein